MVSRNSEVSRREFLEKVSMGAAAIGVVRRPVSAEERGREVRWPVQEAAALPLQLARNESPYGPFPSAVEAMRAVYRKANRYPLQEPIDLEAALAKQHGVDQEQVMLGCGSIEILKIATEEFTTATLKPIVAEPTFEAVVAYSPLRHTTPVKIPVTQDYRNDLGRMAHSALEGAGLIFICNPANPTGTMLDKTEVEQFIRRVPENVVVLADEAYADYVDHPGYESCLRYVREGRTNVIVSRTFSKIYGMAGMRLGYVVGPARLIDRMRPHRLWNNANQLVTAAALASIGDGASVLRVRRLNREVRDQVCVKLKQIGLAYIPSETNFVMIHVSRPAEPVIRQLRGQGILVGRPFPSLPQHIRVSLGTTAEMDLFLQHFKAILREQAA